MRRGTQKERHDFRRVFLFGGLEGIRTLDLSDANRTLSQLSYEPEDHSADLVSQSIIPQFFLFVKPYF